VQEGWPAAGVSERMACAVGQKLSIGGSVHDPTDPVGKLLFNALAMVAEHDLIRERTQVGLAAARARGRRSGRPTALTPVTQGGHENDHRRGAHHRGHPALGVTLTEL